MGEGGAKRRTRGSIRGSSVSDIVENRCCASGKVVQVLYLGEIGDGQRDDWSRAIEAFDEDAQRHTQLSLFSADRELPRQAEGYGVQVRLDAMELHRLRP